MLGASLAKHAVPYRWAGHASRRNGPQRERHRVETDEAVPRDAGAASFLALASINSRHHPSATRWTPCAVASRPASRAARTPRPPRAEPDHFNNQAPEKSAIDSCASSPSASASSSPCRARAPDPKTQRSGPSSRSSSPPRGRRSRYLGEAQGFGLHAAVCVPAHNRFGRELLLRYCGRPPFSLERLSLLPSGHVAYQIKSPWRPDQTHRVMEPREFLARLAALVRAPAHSARPLPRRHRAQLSPPQRRRRARAQAQRRPESPVVLEDTSRAATARPSARTSSPRERCAPAPERGVQPAMSSPASRRPPCARHEHPNQATASPVARPLVVPKQSATLSAPSTAPSPASTGPRFFAASTTSTPSPAPAAAASASPTSSPIPTKPAPSSKSLQLPATPPAILPAHAAPDLLDLPPPDP